MSAMLIRIVADALSGAEPREPTWVREYTPSGHGGRGHLITTTDRARAKRYASFEAAVEAWRAVSATHPTRRDGKPNRPLTAYTVTFYPEDAA